MVGNWKMFKTIEEATQLVESIKAGVYKAHDCEIVVCPTFTALAAVSKAIQGSRIELGAQNMHPENEGAYTGEISPVMIKDVGCRYVILGHSERRQYLRETDVFVNEKLKTALKYSLIPIVCLGETLEEHNERRQFEVVKNQFEKSLEGLTKEEMVRAVIAYEPVWAIGTGKTATPEQAEQMQSYLRRLLKEKYGNETAGRVSILYGGSVKPDNVASLITKPNVDGALVGGASLKADAFVQIVLNASYEMEVKTSK